MVCDFSCEDTGEPLLLYPYYLKELIQLDSTTEFTIFNRKVDVDKYIHATVYLIWAKTFYPDDGRFII